LLERQLVLQSLSDKTGETCNLCVPKGTEMLYLDRVETECPLRISLPVGSRVPLHCTASGKLYLSQMATRERRRLIGSIQFERHTEKTICDPDALWDELKGINEEKVGVDNEEFIDGMVAIAVPISDSNGRFCATIAVHGPLPRLTLDKALGFLPAMRDAVYRLEKTMRLGKSN
jgi:DNA-binding IclR family transcriptional regulator